MGKMRNYWLLKKVVLIVSTGSEMIYTETMYLVGYILEK